MNKPPVLNLWLEGIGAWSPELPDWPALQQWLRDGTIPDAEPQKKPAAAQLSPGERRRAPMSVRLAVEVASQAVAMSTRDAAQLPSLFACAHGDPEILNNICATLAESPAEISPTRFHNSVHNAAAGYWTMATGCHAASNAMTSLDYSFAAALLEAASVACADHTPVLMVASDSPGCGPLAEAIATTEHFGCALVLAPEASDKAIARLQLQTVPHKAQTDTGSRPHWQTLADTNLSARGLPLLAAIANGEPARLQLQAAPALDIEVQIEALT